MSRFAADAIATITNRDPSTDVFCVVPIAGQNGYFAGYAPRGKGVCLLISTTGVGRNVPLRLANIEVLFAVPCKVAEPGMPCRTEAFTSIACTSDDAKVQMYIVELMDLLINVLGPRPTIPATRQGVERLVVLFERLSRPARRSVIGLIGELCVIDAARDLRAAIAAWRIDPEEHFDFVEGLLRIDAKATSGDRRLHSLSFEQANPPHGTIGLLASSFVHQASGGTSLGDFLAELELRVQDYEASMRLRSIVADTLGESLISSLEYGFDLQRARASLRFFDLSSIPAVRGQIPPGVSGVHFSVDVTGEPNLIVAPPLLPTEHTLLPIDFQPHSKSAVRRRTVRSQIPTGTVSGPRKSRKHPLANFGHAIGQADNGGCRP